MRLQKHQLAAYTAALKRGEDMNKFNMPDRLPRKGRDNAEWRIQVACFQWWRTYCRTIGVPECLFFSVPNGAMLGSFANERAIRARMLKMAGMVNGVADAVMLVPRGACHAMLIEFKTPTGVLSDDQQVFKAAVVMQGYQHVVIRSLDEFRETVFNYFN